MSLKPFSRCVSIFRIPCFILCIWFFWLCVCLIVQHTWSSSGLFSLNFNECSPISSFALLLYWSCWWMIYSLRVNQQKTESEQRQLLSLKMVTMETVPFFPLLLSVWSRTFLCNSGYKLAPPHPPVFFHRALEQSLGSWSWIWQNHHWEWLRSYCIHSVICLSHLRTTNQGPFQAGHGISTAHSLSLLCEWEYPLDSECAWRRTMKRREGVISWLPQKGLSSLSLKQTRSTQP